MLREHFDVTCRLVEAGASINDSSFKGEEGRTALQAAVSVGDVDMVEYILSRGADVNTTAALANGVTALQAAVIKGHLRIAQNLFEHGADIDAKAGVENCRKAIEGAAEFGRITWSDFYLTTTKIQTRSLKCAPALTKHRRRANRGMSWIWWPLMNALARHALEPLIDVFA